MQDGSEEVFRWFDTAASSFVLLLQDAAGPTGTGWYAILGIMATGMGAVFAALMLEMRTRRERAEKLVDAAAEDSRKQTAVLAELTLAVREQREVVRQAVEGSTKNRELIEAVIRRLDEIHRRIEPRA